MEGGYRDIVHLDVVRMVVLPPGIRVGDDDLWADPADDGHQTADGLVLIGVSEGPGVGVGLRVLHA